MDVKITGKNVEVPDELELYASRKLEKLTKYSKRLQSAVVSLTDQASKDRHKTCKVEMVLHMPGAVLSAKQESESFYIALDGALEKVRRQLKKDKTKRIDKNRESLSATKVSRAPLARTPSDSPLAKVEVKKFNLKPMSVEEALIQLEQSGHGFYLFVNHDETINCVFKRTDGGYGLLVPETAYGA